MEGATPPVAYSFVVDTRRSVRFASNRSNMRTKAIRSMQTEADRCITEYIPRSKPERLGARHHVP